MSEQNLVMARLVFLLARYKIQVPSEIARTVPGGTWMKELYRGLLATNVFPEQVAQLYKAGEALGPGTTDEAIVLLGNLLDEYVNIDDLETAERISLYTSLDKMKGGEAILEFDELDLSDDSPYQGIPKFNTGMTPLDMVTGGFYQGILLIMAQPGAGKTSLMITLQEEIVRTNVASSTLFVQTEIPSNMMRPRMNPSTTRTEYRTTDRLIAATWRASDIIEWVEAHPDPDRVIFYDSPDVVAQGSGEGLRFAMMAEYLNLIRLKKLCKAIFVTTWPRRQDKSMTLSSPSEAAAKSWYSDMILGISRVGAGLRCQVLKNRFGPTQNGVNFGYDYEDLSWSFSIQEDEDDDW